MKYFKSFDGFSNNEKINEGITGVLGWAVGGMFDFLTANGSLQGAFSNMLGYKSNAIKFLAADLKNLLQTNLAHFIELKGIKPQPEYNPEELEKEIKIKSDQLLQASEEFKTVNSAVPLNVQEGEGIFENDFVKNDFTKELKKFYNIKAGIEVLKTKNLIIQDDFDSLYKFMEKTHRLIIDYVKLILKGGDQKFTFVAAISDLQEYFHEILKDLEMDSLKIYEKAQYPQLERLFRKNAGLKKQLTESLKKTQLMKIAYEAEKLYMEKSKDEKINPNLRLKNLWEQFKLKAVSEFEDFYEMEQILHYLKVDAEWKKKFDSSSEKQSKKLSDIFKNSGNEGNNLSMSSSAKAAIMTNNPIDWKIKKKRYIISTDLVLDDNQVPKPIVKAELIIRPLDITNDPKFVVFELLQFEFMGSREISFESLKKKDIKYIVFIKDDLSWRIALIKDDTGKRIGKLSEGTNKGPLIDKSEVDLEYVSNNIEWQNYLKLVRIKAVASMDYVESKISKKPNLTDLKALVDDLIKNNKMK
jgi:hypothetical protein